MHLVAVGAVLWRTWCWRAGCRWACLPSRWQILRRILPVSILRLSLLRLSVLVRLVWLSVFLRRVGMALRAVPVLLPLRRRVRDASLRLDVTPKEAEVYIDGYLTGTVDDFDGTFQRLHVPTGAHELTLYRDGFKTVHQSLHLSSGSTFKVSYKMEPLAPGEVAEARPTPPPPSSDETEGAPAGPPEGRPSPQAPPRRPPPARSAAGFGTLAIRVQPADAIVLIDGERWLTSSGQDRLVVDVPQGPHRIEIRKEGFDTYSTEITTLQGETVPINVSLRSR